MYLSISIKANELVKGSERFCAWSKHSRSKKSLMYIENDYDETGQVSEKLKEQTLELLDLQQKNWQGRQGNGYCIVTNERSHELNLEYRDTDRQRMSLV